MRLPLFFLLVPSLLVRPAAAESDYVCDYAADDCRGAFDGFCDARFGFCPNTTDCFDCDPCDNLSDLGCGNCTAVPGCVWCDLNAKCLSQGTTASLPSPRFACTHPDSIIASTCDDGGKEQNHFFPDPFYGAQSWVYKLIHLEDVWKMGYTGAGVHVRINDGGTDSNHPDLAPNFSANLSCAAWLPPTDFSEGYDHGTFTAAIAAGAANDRCSAGVAPNATLSACRVLGPTTSVPVAPERADGSYLLAGDVSSNSWGADGCQFLPSRRGRGRPRLLALYNSRRQSNACPFRPDAAPCANTSACASVDWSDLATTYMGNNNTDCEEDIARYCRSSLERDPQACLEFLDWFVFCYYNTVSDQEQDGLVQGVTEGRDQKGIIYVFAPSNGFNAGSNVNFEGFMNSRFTISVGAVGKLGKHASYSSTGVALFISGPGGDLEFISNHVVAEPFTGACRDAGAGTSFATPVVSGVVALMLEANPDLGWRDVQGILASTAQKVDPESDTWITNAAGFHHSTFYGFGLVDAHAAVMSALNWTNWGPERQIISESTSELAISDEVGETVSSTISITDVPDSFVAESTVVYLDLSHSSRGDLSISLTSPQGTTSLLVPGQHPENTNPVERWKLMTLRNWGESPLGDWTLSITDQRTGDYLECVDLPFDLEIEGEKVLCLEFTLGQICADGGPGPEFSQLAEIGATSLNDTILMDPNGTTPDVACCSCGGGMAADLVEDVLQKWRLVVYGHHVETSDASESTSSTTDPPSAASSPLMGILSLSVMLLASMVGVLLH